MYSTTAGSGPLAPAGGAASRGSASHRSPGGDVERLDEGQTGVDRLEGRSEVVHPGLGQRRRPERVEVVGFGELRGIRAELVDGQIVERHGGPFRRAIEVSAMPGNDTAPKAVPQRQYVSWRR